MTPILRYSLLFFLSCFVNLKVLGATFTVTSNADAGAGTLRQALLDAAANGTAQKDFIVFNLPGATEAAITITLTTQLPDVTGNLVIDGTTQPGSSLGVSNAKIIITVAEPAQNLNAFTIADNVNRTDVVEFYGLYIKDFSPQSRGYGSAIVSKGQCKLIIGAPGKGNVICGNWVALPNLVEGAQIQSNFIGIEPDGETMRPNSSILYSSQEYNNLLVGGDTPAEGNVLFCGYDDGFKFGVLSPFSNIQKSATFKNNFFGTDYTGTKIPGQQGYTTFIFVNDAGASLTIADNVFAATQHAIEGYNSAKFKITGNFFGTDKSQTYKLGSGGEAISGNSYVKATIGGESDAEQNVFTNYNNPIGTYNFSQIEIIKNKFYCNTYVNIAQQSRNLVRVLKLLDNYASGDAPPGAKVQLYYSTEQCSSCNPNTWFATVTANGAGFWEYTGAITGKILVSASINGSTTGFQPYSVGEDEVTIVDFNCNHKGSIELIDKREGKFQFIWKNEAGTVVSTGQKAEDLPPGLYYLEISQEGSCPTASGRFTVRTLLPSLSAQSTQLNCTNPTGTLYASGYTYNSVISKYIWEYEDGRPLANTQKVEGLAAGNYYLSIVDDQGCVSDKVLYQVLPPTEKPVIDESAIVLKDAHCDFEDGAITGIKVSNLGSALYGWQNADGPQVYYYKQDLTGMPPGRYYYFANYDYNCPVAKSQTYTIKSINGIMIDESKVQLVTASCQQDNGGVTGITVSGATTYKWLDKNNQTVGTSADLQGVGAGDYHLVASNGFCTAESAVYAVIKQAINNNYPTTEIITPSSCPEGNGIVVVTWTGTKPKAYRWATADDITIIGYPVPDNGESMALNSLMTGTYKLYFTDNNDCESFYKSYQVGTAPQLQIVPGSALVTADKCGQKTGSIKGIQVTGGAKPYGYTWLDASQMPMSTSLDLSELKEGNYTLQVNDASGRCTQQQVYTVINQTENIASPQVNNLQLCAPGETVLSVNNVQPGYRYRLYSSATDANALDEQTGGKFRLTVAGPRSYYFTQLNGECESARAEMKISVGLSALNIANTFTPNGDGVNDTWAINSISNYPKAVVQVYNRTGDKVFESKGYSRAFDGSRNGKQLSAGVYYYIINLNTGCELLSGSLVIIR